MKILTIDPREPDPAVIQEAAETLMSGRLVAFPTETVYGLGGNALDDAVIEKIFAAKSRPAYNPLIAHAPDAEAASRLSSAWPPMAEKLAAAFWPGPLTLVVPKAAVPDRLTAGLPTVAVRVPSHPVARALLAAVPFPVAAPSANRFTGISPTSGVHVERGLRDVVDLILDAGPTAVGIESTVVDLSGPDPVLLRHGSIRRNQVQEVLGTALADPQQYDDAEPRPGPGMTRRHYAPRAVVRIIGAGELPTVCQAESSTGRRVAALVRGDWPAMGAAHVINLGYHPEPYARRLYAALHECEDLDVDTILVEELPRGDDWDAVRDRLTRASQPD